MITIEQLAQGLDGNLWTKGEMKRIYLERGYNTKKMTTKTYVFQREDGSFGVSCYIDCPSQHPTWIESQKKEVIEGVERSIKRAVWEIENPEGDYEEFTDNEAVKEGERQAIKDAEIAAAKKEFDSIKDNLLAAKYLRNFCKRPTSHLFPTLFEYVAQCSRVNGGYYHGRFAEKKNQNLTEKTFVIIPLTYTGSWAVAAENAIHFNLPVVQVEGSNKYDYYTLDVEKLAMAVSDEVKAYWINAREKTAMYNAMLDEEIARLTNGHDLNDSRLDKLSIFDGKLGSELNNAIISTINAN
jgi:hypothetical protein